MGALQSSGTGAEADVFRFAVEAIGRKKAALIFREFKRELRRVEKLAGFKGVGGFRYDLGRERALPGSDIEWFEDLHLVSAIFAPILNGCGPSGQERGEGWRNLIGILQRSPPRWCCVERRPEKH